MTHRLIAVLLALVLVAWPVRAMNNPGPISLGDIVITSAGTQNGAPQTGLSGIDALSLQVRLAYGAGGTTVTAYVQTSLDQGQTWIDIAAIQFGTSGGV
jgi:hypothetical protein